MTLNEFKGRCYLWEHAVSESQMCLKVALRAKKGATQDTQKNEQQDYQVKLQEFKKAREDYQEGITTTQLNDFAQVYERPFPYLAECFAIHDIALQLAIVHFCQIFNSGYGDENAATNIQFQEEHMENIISRVFDTDVKRSQFDLLVGKLKTARDEMIGHADAKAFNILHGTPISTMGGVQNITRDLDLEYWNSFMEELRVSIFKYMNEQKENYT